MKVLHIIAVKDIGGAEKHFTTLLSGLKKEGIDAAACAIPGGRFADELLKKDIPFIPVDFSGKWNPVNVIRVMKVIEEFKPDIIHTHLSKGALIGGIAGKIKGCKTVATKHNLSKSWYYRFADKIITVSGIIKEKLAASGFNQDLISSIYNGIEDDFVTEPSNEELLKIKQKYGININSFVAGMAARLAYVKQHHILLSAAKEVIDKGFDIQFVLCGDGILKKELKNLTRNLGIEKNVIFTGFIENMKEIYPIFDVSILTSKTEGMPMTVIESMAYGIPVIASSVGGIPEIVVNNENGFLFKAGDRSQLAEKIITLINDNKLRKKFGQSAKKTVNEKFSSSDMIRKTIELYKSFEVKF